MSGGGVMLFPDVNLLYARVTEPSALEHLLGLRAACVGEANAGAAAPTQLVVGETSGSSPLVGYLMVM